VEVAREQNTHLAKLLYLSEPEQGCQLREGRFIEKKRVLVMACTLATVGCGCSEVDTLDCAAVDGTAHRPATPLIELETSGFDRLAA
jgi:hypothetical protein